MRKVVMAASALAVLLVAAAAIVGVCSFGVTTESVGGVTHWKQVPDEGKAEVITTMESERDVVRAYFDQRGRDISLSLMVLHPMDLERAEYLAEMFLDRTDELARQYVEQEWEDGDPPTPPQHRYSVRLFSKNDAFGTVGETPVPEEFTILELRR